MRRDEILDEAKRLTMGDREQVYGNVIDNMNHIAALWTAYLGLLKPITGSQVGVMMTLLKFARTRDTAHSDSFVDAAAYAAIAGEVALGMAPKGSHQGTLVSVEFPNGKKVEKKL